MTAHGSRFVFGWMGVPLWLLLTAANCQRAPRPKAPLVIAQVDGRPIYLADWQRELDRARSELVDSQGPTALPTSGLFVHGRAVLDDMISRRLLLQAADAEQLVVSPDEIDAGLGQLQAGWLEATYWQTITHEHFSRSELRGLVREALLIDKYMRDFVFARLAITDAQIEAYAAAHPDALTRPELVRLSQIVVKERDEAQALVQSIRRGRAFADAAQAYSLGPEAKRAGALGVVARGQLPEAFERVVFALPLGVLSPIVSGPQGFYLFWISEHSVARSLPLAQMRNEVQSILRRQAQAEAQTQHVEQLRAAARITIEEAYLAESSA